MIFAFPGHIDQIVEGTKTQTRRNSDSYNVGQTYAVQPGRGKTGDPRGRILIIRKWLEDPGQIITDADAQAEGGYNADEYETLYFKMNPVWFDRWCYEFEFWTTESIESLKQALEDAKTQPSVPFTLISQQPRIRKSKEGLPSIMALDSTPFKKCPLGCVDICNTYEVDACPGCTIISKEVRTEIK